MYLLQEATRFASGDVLSLLEVLTVFVETEVLHVSRGAGLDVNLQCVSLLHLKRDVRAGAEASSAADSAVKLLEAVTVTRSSATCEEFTKFATF